MWQNPEYFRTTATYQNCVQEEVKSRLNLGNACYHSVQNLLSSHLLSKNLKIKIYKTILLPLLLYGCKTWSLTVKEEHRLRVFENRVLRRLELRGKKRWEADEHCIMRNSVICTLCQILIE
jgi:hypothetical protein